jgi:uncharacterized protein (DUF1800 family)
MISNISTLPLPSAEEAARFLGQASLGYNLAEVKDLQTRGYKAWFDSQFALYDQHRANPNAKYMSHFDWMKLRTPPRNNLTATAAAPDNRFFADQVVQSLLRRAVEGGDVLSQRMAFALSEIFVVSVKSGLNLEWPQFMGASYYDMLQRNSLGSVRTLMSDVSRHPAMSRFLTFLGSRKATASTSPDENYARELLQLFTIGLVHLDQGGVPVLDAAGKPQPTYENADIQELARIFTGWVDGGGSTASALVDWMRLPNGTAFGAHDTDEVTLRLGRPDATGVRPAFQIAAGNSAVNRLEAALGYIFNNDNTAPFLSRQLIQRLVTSNPSRDYVSRVSAVFKATQGNLKQVVMAILMDESLFDAQNRRRGGLGDVRFGKVREPWCRLIQWARAFGATSRSGKWGVSYGEGGLDRPTQLGQAPLLAPSVFNFFRPGYVPPQSVTATQTDDAGRTMVAPELQITDEVSVVAFLNFMHETLDPVQGVGRVADITTSYSAWLAKANNPTTLLDDLNLVLTAGRLKGFPGTTVTPNYTRIRNAIATMPVSNDAQRRARIQAAILLVMASPEYLVQQ